MAVFRIEKTRDYTVMSNHHLRNAALSLKAKGLLSQMLSLPAEWDYTLAGLSRINRESVDAIRTAVWELEKAGYVVRRQGRDGKGKMTAIEYTIYEQPQNRDATPPPEDQTCPMLDYPILENPTSDNPISDNPTSENPTQLNKEVSNKENLNKDISNIDSVPILSPDPFPQAERRKRNGTAGMEAMEIYREIIRENIEYGHMIERHDKGKVDGIVDLMLETVCTSRKTVRVAGDDYPAELVRSKFLKLNSGHIDYIFECMRENTTEVRNIKKYLLAVLFNAPSTIDSHYSALVQHDLYGGS